MSSTDLPRHSQQFSAASPTSSSSSSSAAASSSSSASSTTFSAIDDAYLHQIRMRAADLSSSLNNLINTQQHQQQWTDKLPKLSIITTQIQTLYEELFTNPQFELSRSAASACLVYPLVSGYSPVEQLRIKPIPEIEQQQLTVLQRFNQTIDPITGLTNEGLTGEEIASRLNDYNAGCLELHSLSVQLQSQLSSSQPIPATEASTATASVSSNSAEDLQRALRYMWTGRGLRAE